MGYYLYGFIVGIILGTIIHKIYKNKKEEITTSYKGDPDNITREEAIKNLKEITDLVKEDIYKGNEEVTAIFDAVDLKCLIILLTIVEAYDIKHDL